MKLIFASDIHGSAFYAQKVVDAFEAEKADKLILLGDLLYHGPRNDLPRNYAPKAVIPLLNGLKDKILAVRGNCDSEVDQMVLEFPILADYALLMLENGRTAYLTHGHTHNEANLPPLATGDILIHGHTHVQVMEDRGSYIFINPGSTSIPKENTCHSYMIYQNGVFTIKNIETAQEVKSFTL
ncbi:MAG: phosphodiesterase [Oscillospiraceae bacterium]|nr:phosphodiesterase [Oscillospiraceae bacterium]